MKKYEWNEGLNNLDPDIVDEYLEQKNALAKRKDRSKILLRIGAMAPCVCLIIGILLALPRPDAGLPGNSGQGGISTPIISVGEKLTGVQEKVYGSPDFLEDTSGKEIPGAGFRIHIVLHVRVEEILPDTYYIPDVGYEFEQSYRIARLSIIESLRGEGFPEEIYLRFPYHPADVLEGYDSLFITAKQVGVENYLMINKSQNEITYFPNMFSVTGPEDVLYGAVIPINDGKIDESFWDKYNNIYNSSGAKSLLSEKYSSYYPASHGSSLEEIKERIEAMILERNEATADYVYPIKSPYDYYTASDIFTSDEAKAVKEYVQPSESNSFVQRITINNDRVIGFYSRIIGGFASGERIVVNGYTGEIGNVLIEGCSYSPEDLVGIPDLGTALDNLDFADTRPTHLSNIDDLEIKYAVAKGFYRKSEDRVLGIIRIFWYCVDPEDHYVYYMDDCYYLYDEEGYGRVVERDELRAVIGDDFIIASFKHDEPRGFPEY